MTADVSSLIRVMTGHMEEQQVRNESGSGTSKVLITRDLLGGCSSKSKDLDLDMHVPHGWEKRLDLKSGKVYLQRCNSPNSPSSSSSSDHNNKHQQKTATVPELQDLNFPLSSTHPLNLLEESNLELKLLPSCHYESVCTLDKVKSALERAEKETMKKRSSSPSVSLLSSQSQSSPLIKEGEDEEKRSPSSSGMLFAAGCPGCLLYVLTSRRNPKCPRCDSIVPSPVVLKRPRIDLNASIRYLDYN